MVNRVIRFGEACTKGGDSALQAPCGWFDSSLLHQFSEAAWKDTRTGPTHQVETVLPAMGRHGTWADRSCGESVSSPVLRNDARVIGAIKEVTPLSRIGRQDTRIRDESIRLELL